jgi:hypothetical protein
MEKTPNLSSKNGSYAVRYAAFLDIIGFRSLLDDLRAGIIGPSYVLALLRESREIYGPSPPLEKQVDFKIHGISDAVVVSAAPTAQGLLHLFGVTELLGVTLLETGHLIRGGIAKGLLYHDEQFAFGDALVEAYRLESECAEFPRVLISSSVEQDFVGFFGRDPSDLSARNHLVTDEDGLVFLHLLRDPQSIAYTMMQTDRSYYSKTLRRVQMRYHESLRNPKHRKKWTWFANYWNKTFPHTIVGKIKGEGL